MARIYREVRRTGLVILAVVAGHLLLGGLLLIAHAPPQDVAKAPVSEVWLLPPLMRKSGLSTVAQSSGHNPDQTRPIRRHNTPTDPLAQGHDIGVTQTDAIANGAADEPGVRERLGAVLRHGQACRKAIMSGGPLPPDCPERGYAHVRPLPVKPGPQPYWEAQVAANEAQRRYKADPGNVDYWKRVNGTGSPRYSPPDLPTPGAYDTRKQQMMHHVDARTDDYYRLKRETGPKP